MSHLISDDDLLDDMAACLQAFREWLMHMSEEWPEMDNSHLDELLGRYRDETGRPPPRIRQES